MRPFEFLYPALLTVSTLYDSVEASKVPEKAVLLSNVKTLTLRKDLKTSHRRVSAIPQLRCVGGDARGLYDVDVMRCKNQGADYDDQNIQWTCTASLPSEFKLGATDVICEGYSHPDDPYILKGSCGVEYKLMLTDAGEEKYRSEYRDFWRQHKPRGQIDWSVLLFWAVFVAVVVWIIYSAYIRSTGQARVPRGANPLGWGGWGGGGGGGGADDPPPPYDYQPPRKQYTSNRRTPSAAAAQQGWRPGFLTGALGGAAAGYYAGNRGQTRNQDIGTQWGFNGGEGSSRSGSGRSGSSGSSSSSRYEGTGFGSTSRR
ncbi:MAG: hypothetical protein M1825_004422 [Sarcosagium campestre]|nr:MAG: hypothetical protein M1825_004422 [Sarcosagium campestre]